MDSPSASAGGLSSAVLGWRLLAVAGAVAFLVVGKLLEGEQKPRRIRDEGDGDAEGKAKAARERGERGGVGLLGLLGWEGGAGSDEDEEEEEEERGAEGAEVVAALAGTGSKEEQAQARAWEAAEHEFRYVGWGGIVLSLLYIDMEIY